MSVICIGSSYFCINLFFSVIVFYIYLFSYHFIPVYLLYITLLYYFVCFYDYLIVISVWNLSFKNFNKINYCETEVLST